MVEEKKKEELEMVEVLVGKVDGEEKVEEKQAKDNVINETVQMKYTSSSVRHSNLT